MTDHMPAMSLPSTAHFARFEGGSAPDAAALIGAALDGDVDAFDVSRPGPGDRLIFAVWPDDVADPERLQTRLLDTARTLNMETTFFSGPRDTASTPGRSEDVRVTILGTERRVDAVVVVVRRIIELGGKPVHVRTLGRRPVDALEFVVTPAASTNLEQPLRALGRDLGVDICVLPVDPPRQTPRLLVMDVDSTLIQGEVIEMIAAHAGCEAEVADVTERAMRGELDFAGSLHARVALLRGVREEALDEVYDELKLTDGATELIRTVKRFGYRVALVSGGFTQIISRLSQRLGIDYFAANELEIVDGLLTGRVLGEVVDRAGKAAALRRFGAQSQIDLAHTVAVGDGANDLDMLDTAALGVAFNAKPVVREQAQAAVNVPRLDAVLHLLGFTRAEIDATADAEPLTPGLRA